MFAFVWQLREISHLKKKSKEKKKKRSVFVCLAGQIRACEAASCQIPPHHFRLNKLPVISLASGHMHHQPTGRGRRLGNSPRADCSCTMRCQHLYQLMILHHMAPLSEARSFWISLTERWLFKGLASGVGCRSVQRGWVYSTVCVSAWKKKMH